MTTPRVALIVGIALSLLAPAALAKNQNEQRLDVTLTPSLFAPSRAIGDATLEERRHRTDFEVEVEDLDPGQYDVFVAGLFVGQLTVNPVVGGTEGSLEFSSHAATGKLPLGFDPRGKSIEVRLGATVLLSGSFPTVQNPEAPDDQPKFNKVVQTINAVYDEGAVGPRPRGTLKLVSGGRHASLLFTLQRLDRSPHVITANGIDIASFTPLAGGIARVRFSTNPGKNDLPLDFDPADTTFEVVLNGEVLLEFKTGDKPIGGGATPIGQVEASFNRTDADDDASGIALMLDRPSRFDFDVEVENLPVGSYALLVGGNEKGQIFVSLSSDITRGLLRFSTRSAPGKLPLTFDPRGQTIQIVKGADVFLSLTFPR